MQLKSINDFIAWTVSSQKISFKPIYVDATGDLIAGLLLSQIAYWFLPDRNGNKKVVVERDGKYWLCKKRTEWYNEIRISPTQYDRAVEILRSANIIETQVYKFGGTPRVHITLKFDTLIGLLNEQIAKNPTALYDIKVRASKVKKTKVDEYQEKVNEYLEKRSEKYKKVFDEFIYERKTSMKSPMSNNAKYKMLAKLQKHFPNDEAEHIRRFERSIQNGWKGVIFANEIKKKTNREGY